MLMIIFQAFLPILMFIGFFLGAGFYFLLNGSVDAFYQVSPIAAILPALVVGWFLHKGNSNETVKACINGASHPDIITMCLIFILAAIFSRVTFSIGSVNATVNCALSLVNGEFLLIGIFLTAAFIATAIGTSMGTIATIGPIAIGLSQQGIFPLSLGIATVVGGAMFGDNLSLVSDTTIAAVASQEADMMAKFRLNALIAVISGALTIFYLSFCVVKPGIILTYDYQPVLLLPYLVLIALSAFGLNVFVGLMTSISLSIVIGFFYSSYSLVQYSIDVVQGCADIHSILILSLCIGALSGLINTNLQNGIAHGILKIRSKSSLIGQLVIASIVSIFDILIANNTIAIIMTGPIARIIAKNFSIEAHKSAAWLDIFACVFQGIIPYGAQILLASSLAGISPFVIVPYVYYCYILGCVALLFIFFKK